MAASETQQQRNWMVGSQEHMDSNLYARYHRDVWLPESVRVAAAHFLPFKDTELPLSAHYTRIQRKRRLPTVLRMPWHYDLIDVTTVRGTGAIFRVFIRAAWNHTTDFCMVLEGDHEVVTAFFISAGDMHQTLDVSVYEERPPSAAEERLLATLPLAELQGEKAARRQSRPDDVT